MGATQNSFPGVRPEVSSSLKWCLPLVGVLLLLLPEMARAQIDLAVRATDQETGAPIEQLRVELVLFPDSIVVMGFTDGSGRIEFRNLQKLKYVLRAAKTGYQRYQESLDLSTMFYSAIVAINMRKEISKPVVPGEGVSVRVLSIPDKARREFEAGMKLLGEKNDPKGSIGHFQSAIAEFPEYYEAYYLLGMAQLKIGDAAAGEAALRKSIELEARFFDPYYPLSELMIRRQQFDETVKLLQLPYQEDNESWKWPYELAVCFDKLGRYQEGIEMGRKALERKEAPSKIRLLLSNLYEISGQIPNAIAELEAFKKEDPKNPIIPKVNQVLDELRKKK